MATIKPDGQEQLLFTAAVLPNMKQIGPLDLILLVTCQIERHFKPLQAFAVSQCFRLSIVKSNKVLRSLNERIQKKLPLWTGQLL
jgi:hypothetical protein